jgi:hypothetical protein
MIGLLFLILVVLILWRMNSKESFDIVGMENVYSNLFCIDPNLPVIKTSSGVLSCISPTNNSGDCLKYSDFKVPPNYSCTNMDTYITKDGLRDISSTSRKLFDNLMKNGYYTFSCGKNELSDPNHWCGKIKGSIVNKCNEQRQSPVCNNNLLKNVGNSSVNFNSSNSFKDRSTRCSKVNCPRQRVIPKQLCEANCSLCGETSCNM